MKIRLRTRTGYVEAEGRPRDVLRLLWGFRRLALAGPDRARRMLTALRREAEKRGLLS